MENKKDIILDFPASFLKKNKVLYVAEDMGASPSGWMDRLQPEIEDLFREADKKLVLLPDLINALNPEMISYMFPGQGELILSPVGSQLSPGFVYKENGNVYFHAITAMDDEQVLEEIRDFTLTLSIEIAEPTADYAEAAMSQKREKKACKERRERKAKLGSPSFWDIPFSATSEAEQEHIVLDPRAQAILDAWSKIESKFGITIEELELLLGYRVKLSQLNITTSGKIFLTDFDNQEVKMDDLTKAVYFFYLRHPEGAALKELQDHEEEILRIYSGITGRDDVKKIRESVRNLLDPFSNNLNVSMSRIKKAFKDVVGDRIARFYYVSGSYGEKRKIEIDRDLVIWEPCFRQES